MPEAVKNALILSAGAAVGAATGGGAGALTSLSEIDNNYLSHKRPAGFGKLSEQEQFEKSVAACSSGNKDACETRDKWIKLSQDRDLVVTNACSASSAADCSAHINQANAAGNKVIFDSKGNAVIYKQGSAELVASSSVGDGSFHYALAKSTLDGLEFEAVGAAGSAILGWGAKAVGYVRAGIFGGEPAVTIGAGTTGLVDSEVSALKRIAANNRVDLGSEARMARIDDLAKANSQRRLGEAIDAQDFVYRYLSEKSLSDSIRYSSLRGYTSTEFSMSSAEVANRAQILPEWDIPKYGVKIPVSELKGFSVARPMGGGVKAGLGAIHEFVPCCGFGWMAAISS